MVQTTKNIEKEEGSGLNLICTPFAFKKGANTGVNIKGDAYNVYMKNACVALCSAKYYNSDCEVALVTNIPEEQISDEYINVFKQFDIKIIEIPFDYFRFADKYEWSLAFYKLCTLKHLTNSKYENICYLDTDVYVQSNLNNLWRECRNSIMLYDINHGLQVTDYQIICDEFKEFLGKKAYLTHYGGEFLASNIEVVKPFVDSLETVYKKMINDEFITTKGDEFLLSVAAEQCKNHIKNAGAYIHRFWTAPGFRLVSSCYEYNPISILHLPNEKNKGMIQLYEAFISKGKIPSNKKVWKICRLSSITLIDRMKIKIKKII